MNSRVRDAAYYVGYKALSSGLAFVSGLLCVRSLSVTQFGIYSIATVMISVVGVIAEAGTSSTLLRRASAVEATEDQAAEVRAAVSVRSIVSVAVAVPSAVLLVVVLLLNHVALLQTVLITVLVVANVGPTVASSIFLVGLQIADRFRLIRRLDLGASVLRLALIAVFWASGTASVPVLIAVALVTVIAQRAVEARVLRPYLRGAAPSPDRRAVYWTAVLQSLPTSVLMVVGEQVVVVVLTLVGNTEAIGQIAALGKYAALFTLLNSLLFTMIAPLLARLNADRVDELRRQVLRLLGAYLVIAVLFTAGAAICSPLLLAVLGAPYRSLAPELVVVSAGVAVSNFAVFGLGSVNHARGWLRFSWTYLPALVVWLIIGVLTLPLASPLGAAVFSASLSLCVLLSHLWRMGAGWRALRREESVLRATSAVRAA